MEFEERISKIREEGSYYLKNRFTPTEGFDDYFKNTLGEEKTKSLKSFIGGLPSQLIDIALEAPRELGKDLAWKLYEDEMTKGKEALEEIKLTHPEIAKELEDSIGENPTTKKLIGDIAGTVLTGVSAMPGIGIVSLGSKTKAATILGKTIKQGSLGEKILISSKFSAPVRVGLEGGFWGGSFSLADAMSDNKETEEMLKAAGVGTLAGVVASELLTGSLILVSAGMSRTAKLKPVVKIKEEIGSSEVVNTIRNYVDNVANNLAHIDKNFVPIVQKKREATRDTDIALARIINFIQDTPPTKVDKFTFEGAEEAYEFSRQILRKSFATPDIGKGVKTLGEGEQGAVKTAVQLFLEQGGATVSLNGEIIKKGYALSPYKAFETVIPEEKFRKNPIKYLSDYVRKNIKF